MKEGPTKGPRGVHSENRKTSYTPRRPEFQADLPELRRIWWRIVATGDRLPPEVGVIVIEGGR